MSTRQDIYAIGSENRPPMLNKELYDPWSSRLLRFAKSRPNRMLIYNSIINGPYVRLMIHGLDIYVAVDSCETSQEIWLRVQQMMKGSDIGIQEKKAKLFNEWERFTSTDGESIESYYHRFTKLMNDFKRNKHFPEKIASNLKFLNNLQPEWSRHVTIVHQTKYLHTADYTQLYDFLKYNQKEVDDLRAERLAKIQDPLALMNVENQVVQNAVQNLGVQNVGNQKGLIVVLGIANQNPNGNGIVVAAWAEGNAIGNNGNQIRCYNCKGLGHLARNCTVTRRRRDDAYLQTQLLIAQTEEQSSTSGTQTDKALVYDSDGSAEVSEQKDTTKGTSTNTKFTNQSTERKPFLQSLRNTFVVRQPNEFQSERLNFSKARVLQKVDKTNDMSNPVTSKLVPTTKESKVRQFCDSNLEAAFRRNTCFIRNLKGDDLLKGNHTTNLYTINLHDMASASPICLMARTTSTKSCLWHQRLSHLNLDTNNDLARNDLVTSLPKFKFYKEHLCSSCEQRKSKRASHPPKPVPNSKALCYPKNDREDIGKLGAKGDIGFFISYSANSFTYRVYNRRTKKIMETMKVTFDELSDMSFEQRSLKPELQNMTSGQISLGLDLTYALSTITT
uniref:Integrase, catalytic region, zinc finger, CCHC-type, peptidase aspartic, catalytic n=1 Tax=Tanacetum cinerariifolium TaxID=118510 RepID=A0A6L2KTL5_TANCI|nr:integrase, catalytic region, zinc finger, CCHC-type, peptidase aspartic, catalytic [Tanacetum cinerariifolium]